MTILFFLYLYCAYYKNGREVINQCCYYDCMYKKGHQNKILNLLNHEICRGFTHMIVTDGIDIDSNRMPLCGAL